ncbi:Mannose-6-phosphate isomerase, cupin superfamily [Mariprofundus aestuarium]|uniref:Mannose-6-phosphate isomerase, cupin superfamily n=1 Tax=Mariprofundus aestuarium TaxID=1921086 RepID=A0A2K8KZF7_MARES|nr:cupin domain-containing protein [Mariprofundus aestuarium]ATX79299.1 Mannose-6-phosphate isomerase, cupin superfamily [Mariprofundus aestuarium]
MKIIETERVEPEGLSHDPNIMKRILFHEGELPGSVRFSHALFKPGQRASAHLHEDLHEIFYILVGSGTIVINGERHGIKGGSCIRIDPGEEHELINSGQEDLAVIYFGLEG